jgi:hypothetical protein
MIKETFQHSSNNTLEALIVTASSFKVAMANLTAEPSTLGRSFFMAAMEDYNKLLKLNFQSLFSKYSSASPNR